MEFKSTTNLTSKHYVGRMGVRPRLIGIHTMEAPETGDTAEEVARYFKTVDASSHWCVDDNSRVRVVADTNAAWTMPPMNNESLNVEMAGYASQNARQWNDQYSADTLFIASVVVAEWCHKYSIPVKHLSHAEIAGNHAGIVGHIDVNAVYHVSTHTDPGVNFPWGTFLGKVRNHLDVLEAQHDGS
jgi:N-acetyl-anhydromuramyl-L-alanine amidase AmpD